MKLNLQLKLQWTAIMYKVAFKDQDVQTMLLSKFCFPLVSLPLFSFLLHCSSLLVQHEPFSADQFSLVSRHSKNKTTTKFLWDNTYFKQ